MKAKTKQEDEQKSVKAYKNNWLELKTISLKTGETIPEILARIVPIELRKVEKRHAHS